MKRFTKLCMSFVLFFGIAQAENEYKSPKPVKLLVLIIASDHFPVYVAMQKVWKAYMNYDPQHVEAYFIRADPNLPTLFSVEENVIWSKTDEGWPPASAGIINKTILSMEAMLPRLHEFDYVLRTNLSSFYVFPKLLQVLQGMPRQKFYFGSNTGAGSVWGSGCGFILSTDLVRLMVQHKDEFIGNKNHDDVLVGQFLHKKGIKLIQHKRHDLLNMNDWNAIKDKLPSDIFQYRVKNDDKVRLVQDIYMQTGLLERIYGIKI